MKFTPTPKQDKVEIIKDTEEFCRKLRLREFFRNEQDEDISLVRNRKGFKPPINRDRHLEEYITCLRTSANSNTVEKPTKSNISKDEHTALENIRKDNSIIIKEADKGGAIVIMDRNYYKSLAQEQLDDMNFYTKLESNKDRPTMIKIKNLTSRFEGNLTKNEIDYLTNFEVKTSNF